jgi:hypothetical protein
LYHDTLERNRTFAEAPRSFINTHGTPTTHTSSKNGGRINGDGRALTRERREVSIEAKIRGGPFLTKNIYKPPQATSPKGRYDISIYKAERINSYKVVTKEQLLGPRIYGEVESQGPMTLGEGRVYSGMDRGWVSRN